MTKQLEIDFESVVSRSMDCSEKKRLGGQCLAILERLKLGRVSNVELSKISLKYTSRISDIRKAGYDVRLVDRHQGSGLTHYELFGQE